MTTERLARRPVLTAAAAAMAAGTSTARAATPIKRWRHYSNGRFGQVHFFSGAPVDEKAIKHPPLICMHPSPTSGEMYRDMVTYLATDRVVHCPDTAGFGGSDPPPMKPTMADYGGDLAEAVANLGFGRDTAKGQVDIFGFHTGSLCAVEFAAQRPDLVRKAVLSGVPHYTPEERARQRKQNVPGYPYFTDPNYVAGMYKRLVLEATNSGTPEDRLRRFGDRLRAGANGWWGPDAVFTHDTGAVLPKLTMPVLLIAFNEQMTQPTRDAAKIIPGAKLIEMLDLPIFGFIVAPERVATTIKEFLDA